MTILVMGDVVDDIVVRPLTNVDPGGERTMYVDRGANATFTGTDVPADSSLVRTTPMSLPRNSARAGAPWC